MLTQNLTFRTYLLIALILIAFLPTAVFALTPIARYDVVPNQRIAHGTTFKFGVVAFSKAEIASVKFTISGRGYSGGVKTATAMTKNDRTDVFEYWVPISSNEFTSSGPFTVAALVTGRDGDTRNLGALTLNVDATNSLAQPTAWVSKSGSNSTGKINSSSQPFSTVEGAISAIQAANSGSSDGAVIYLKTGTYTIGTGATKTTNEWLTITKDPSVKKTEVIITGIGSALDTRLARLKDVTLQYTNNIVINTGIADLLWLDGCRILGNGRQYPRSNPIASRYWTTFWTGNYIANLDLAINKGLLSRNNHITTISDDAHQNTALVINDRIDDVNPSQNPNKPHADAYQIHVTNVPSPDNFIVYGMYATNLAQQGIFARPSSEGSPPKRASNIAFVNNFVESRAGYANELQGIWDHLLIWHNTFPTNMFRIYKDGLTNAYSFTNTSIVGNYFYEFYEAQTHGVDFNKGNTKGNETLNNHYRYSRDDGYGSTFNTYSPDTALSASDSVGTVEIDLTDRRDYVNYGSPISNSSVLVNRVSNPKVVADSKGVPRGAVADVGAIERSLSKSPPSAPKLF